MSQQGVDFSKTIIKIKMIFWFEFHRHSHGRQKLGTILENKVIQKLKFSKNDNNKKPSSKLIFFNEKKSERFGWFFYIEKLLWKSDLGTFWRPMWTSVKVKSIKYFSFTDFLLTSAKLHHWGHTELFINKAYCSRALKFSWGWHWSTFKNIGCC